MVFDARGDLVGCAPIALALFALPMVLGWNVIRNFALVHDDFAVFAFPEGLITLKVFDHEPVAGHMVAFY